MKQTVLLLLAIMGSLFLSCKDDESPILPPTVEDIVKSYKGDNLKLTANGEVLGDAIVDLIVDDKENLSIKLNNVVDGVSTFIISNAEFETATKSTYYSKISGSSSDIIMGYKVTAVGTIEDDVLDLVVNYEEVEEAPANAFRFLDKMYKGEMQIKVPGVPDSELEQRVYVQRPRDFADDSTRFKLTIKNFSFTGIELGDISIDTIPLMQRSEEVYSYKISGVKLKLPVLGEGTDPIEVVCNLRGTIVNNKMDLSLVVEVPTLFNVDVLFSGLETIESTDASVKAIKFKENTNAVESQPYSKNRTSYGFRLWVDNGDTAITPILELGNDKASVTKVIARINNVEKELTYGEAINFADFSSVTPDLLQTAGFSDHLKYEITPEDPNGRKTYVTLVVEKLGYANTKFTYTKWNLVNEVAKMYEPENWGTSNTAAVFLKALSYYPTGMPDPVTYDEATQSAKIISVDTKGANAYFAIVPALTAGTLFNGMFITDVANTLRSTKFGVGYRNEPTQLKGRFKYTHGETYIRTIVDGTGPGAKVSRDTLTNVIDSCSIAAVLYEVEDYSETLTGVDIYTSSKVVSIAKLANGAQTADFVEFTADFNYLEGKSFNPSKKYKLAIISSSSAKGDKFEGAPGSELLVKSLEIVNK